MFPGLIVLVERCLVQSRLINSFSSNPLIKWPLNQINSRLWSHLYFQSFPTLLLEFGTIYRYRLPSQIWLSSHKACTITHKAGHNFDGFVVTGGSGALCVILVLIKLFKWEDPFDTKRGTGWDTNFVDLFVSFLLCMCIVVTSDRTPITWAHNTFCRVNGKVKILTWWPSIPAAGFLYHEHPWNRERIEEEKENYKLKCQTSHMGQKYYSRTKQFYDFTMVFTVACGFADATGVRFLPRLYRHWNSSPVIAFQH